MNAPASVPEIETGRVPLGATGALICTLGEYKGRRTIDVRKFYTPAGGEQMRRTPKGITLDVERLPALAALVNGALERARADGLLPDEQQPANTVQR
jgi:hypothetical protein